MKTEKKAQKILFVADDKKIVRSVNSNLRKQFNVINYSSENFDAIEVEQIKPDVILLSLNDDRNSNYSISGAIKINCGLQSLPLIYLFDIKNSEEVQLVFENGGVDFAALPLNFAELSARINYQIKAKKSNVHLSEQLSERDKLFSIISHDLRKPFASLMGITHLLSESAQFCTFDELRDLAKENYKTVTNTYHLLENLLEWCKVKCGQVEFKPAIIDVGNLVRRVVSHLKDFAVKKNIVIENNIGSDSKVFADERMIYTVLKNLIENAIKFSEAGSNIVITKNDLPDKVTIFIKDYGVGIQKDELKKLFEISNPYSTKGTEGERGSGLGLILSKELIHKNGGELTLKSKFGAGSKLGFTLPKQNIQKNTLIN
ncbi:MAG: HAMP domain-containing histidine kinase [Ignavibacteriae bacterium]|nr:sensor histidine kinase [Ignavibacteriota bacterium]NOG97356.1 HAMP domain-containing histidine kinase [Ignavibacteriota bacterium]